MFLFKSLKNTFKNLNNNSNYKSQTKKWSGIATKEELEFEKANIDLTNITIYFKNNIICNVIPDVHDYYYARYYNINGILYDTKNISSVMSIPLTKSDLVSGTPVYNLEYLLRKRAIQERELGNIKLAYTLLEKSTNLMFNSKMMYSPSDYLKIVSWLYLDGNIAEANKIKQKILTICPNAYNNKIRKKPSTIMEYTEKVSININDMIQFSDIPFDWEHIHLINNRFVPNHTDQLTFLSYIKQVQNILLACNITQINTFNISIKDIAFNFVKDALTSYVSCSPYTKTKRISKYPVVLYFISTTSSYCGWIYILTNGTIGKVSLYFDNEDTTINMLLSNGNLIVSKVYTYYGCIYDYKLKKDNLNSHN